MTPVFQSVSGKNYVAIAPHSPVAAARSAAVLTRRRSTLPHDRKRTAAASGDMSSGGTHQLVHRLGLALRTGGRFIPTDKFLELTATFAAFKIKHRHEAAPFQADQRRVKPSRVARFLDCGFRTMMREKPCPDGVSVLSTEVHRDARRSPEPSKIGVQLRQPSL